MISDIKIEESFPKENFTNEVRLERDSNVGVIMLYVGEDIPSNLIASNNKHI